MFSFIGKKYLIANGKQDQITPMKFPHIVSNQFNSTSSILSSNLISPHLSQSLRFEPVR